MLQAEDRLLLDALRCAVHEQSMVLEHAPEASTLQRLILLARQHAVLPLLVQASGDCGLFPDREHGAFREARLHTLKQASKTAEFLLLLEELKARGLRPVVLKGIVCRSMYPEPEQRESTDEDLMIPPEDYPAFRDALLDCGLQMRDPNTSDGMFEVSFVDPERDLYLELHLRLFDPEALAYSDCNRFFDDALSRSVELSVYGQTLRTLHPTDHLLYMLCHAYKHILYYGVGIRQICDICLFASRFGEEIDWISLKGACRELRIEKLSAAFFLIGQRYLDLSMPAAFADVDVDELPLLKDCLAGGLYGADDADRLHSSHFTLDAVAAAKMGRGQRGLLRALFPKADSIKKSYPYLNEKSWLLPLAWAQRLLRYAFTRSTSTEKTLEVGRTRIALLGKYDLLN